MFDFLIVGAGFAGSVCARQLAEVGKKILVCDKRPHIGGNAYDFQNEHGVLVHKYGPHIFHTNSQTVFDYLSRFTAWRDYEHRVLASVDGQLVPFPINLDTINWLYRLNLDSKQLETWLSQRAESVPETRTSEQYIVSKVGRDLYEKFFADYTRKQWGMGAGELDSSVAARIPVRTNRDDRYFTDTFQAMPAHGYSRLFENLLDHENISLSLETECYQAQALARYEQLIYTGPIDEFFDYSFGKLPYRSLRFDWETRDEEYSQNVATINFPSEKIPFTRQTEFKHMTRQTHAKTTLCREYSQSEGDPFYPIPCRESRELYRQYRALADSFEGVHFVGRLGSYRYMNMDQVVAQALKLCSNLL